MAINYIVNKELMGSTKLRVQDILESKTVLLPSSKNLLHCGK